MKETGALNQYIPHFAALLAGGLVAYLMGSFILTSLEGERISWRVKLAVVFSVLASSSGLIVFVFREQTIDIALSYALGFTLMLIPFRR